MTTATQYAKMKVLEGKFPVIHIVSGENGTYWLHDEDYKTLVGNPFMSYTKAEYYRSKVISNAANKYGS